MDILGFSADGSTLASTHEEKIVRLWDTKTWRVRTTIDDPVVALSRNDSDIPLIDRILSLAIAPDGNTLAAGLGTVVAIWDGKTGKRRNYTKDYLVNSLSFGEGGRTLAIATESESESPMIIDLETGYELDWSNRPFPNRKTAYWLAGVFLLVSALTLSRMKRRRRREMPRKMRSRPPPG